jgi:hypothetical protein
MIQDLFYYFIIYFWKDYNFSSVKLANFFDTIFINKFIIKLNFKKRKKSLLHQSSTHFFFLLVLYAWYHHLEWGISQNKAPTQGEGRAEGGPLILRNAPYLPYTHYTITKRPLLVAHPPGYGKQYSCGSG